VKATKYILMLAVVFLLSSAIPYPIRAAATVQTDQPLYTQRGKQVALIGSGYVIGVTYYVWWQGPGNNETSYSGVSFAPVTGGYMPPDVSLPIAVNALLGTYLVSVSTSATSDDAQARAHYGLWGTTSPVYQRTQSVKIVGGGLFPGTSLKLNIRDSAGDFVDENTIVANAQGDFNHTWRIPENAVTDAYTIFIDGTGTFDNAQQDYVSTTKFSVTQATLNAKITAEPDSSYERTQIAKVSFALQYPDGSPVLKSKQGSAPVLLLQNQTTVAFVNVSLVDNVNGIWGARAKIPVNATLGSSYRFGLPSMAFDDGFGNLGGSVDTYSNFFQVRNASLVMNSKLNGTQIQVPFDQVSIISKISYPDGMPFTNGTVKVLVSAGSTNSTVELAYDPSIGAWRGSYSSTISDLWRVGTWTLQLEATDTYGNSATATYEVTAQPYLLAVLIGIIVAVVLFGRWAINRFGRKVYLRTRKLIQRFRRVSMIIEIFHQCTRGLEVPFSDHANQR
jgi:hypothetical protein